MRTMTWTTHWWGKIAINGDLSRIKREGNRKTMTKNLPIDERSDDYSFETRLARANADRTWRAIVAHKTTLDNWMKCAQRKPDEQQITNRRENERDDDCQSNN